MGDLRAQALAALLLSFPFSTAAAAGSTDSSNPIVCNINDDSTQDLAYSGFGTTDRVITIAPITAEPILASFPQTGNGAWGLEACAKVGSAGLISQGALGGGNDGFVRILELNSTGASVVNTEFVPRGGGAFTFVGHADVDGDGLQDLVLDGEDGTPAEPFAKVAFVFGPNAGSVLFLSTAGGTFGFAGSGDTNGDGLEDLLWVTEDGSVLRIDLSNGTSEATRVFLSLAGGQFTVNGVGDLTGDGKADLVLNGATTTKLVELDGGTELSSSFLPNGGCTLVPTFVGDTSGDGSGSVVFVGSTTTRVNVCNGVSPIDCSMSGTFDNEGFIPKLLGDFDGDGSDDLISGISFLQQFILLDGVSVKRIVGGQVDGGIFDLVPVIQPPPCP